MPNTDNQHSANNETRVVVFAASMGAQGVLHLLSQQRCLAGVIVPDPSELGEHAAEINHLIAQLQHAGIPYQACCKAKLPLVQQQLHAWKVNLGIIFGYPHILPPSLLTECQLGMYNLHASKLPEYRGPRPIYWQIRHQVTHTKLVLHRALPQVDCGNVVAQKDILIDALDTHHSLSNRIAYEAPFVVAELLEAIKNTGAPPQEIPQDSAHSNTKTKATYAHRPTEKDFAVHFDQMTAADISAICRAGNGLPYAAVFTLEDNAINIIQATPVNYPTYGTKPGTVIYIGEPEGLIICVKSGALRLDVVSCVSGIFSGLTFSEHFHLDAGTQLGAPSFSSLQQPT